MPASYSVKSVPGHILSRDFLRKMTRIEVQRVADLARKEKDDGNTPDQDAVQGKDELSSITCPDLAGSHNLPL